MSAPSDRVVRLGQIAGVHGVRGWIKVHSFTEPRANLLGYPKWLLALDDRELAIEVEATRESGKRLLAKLKGIDDRDAADKWTGAAIGVRRSDMPELPPDEYYWTDLEGLVVRNTTGATLGTVRQLIATGANDVLVLDGGGRRLIPFIRDRTVRRVDLDAGEIVVDWDASYWD